MKHFTPTLISSFFCIILFYTGFLSVNSYEPFFSLVENSKIDFLQGTVVSNPVKSSSGKTYSVVFALSKVSAKSEISASASGEVTLYIPAEIVEAYYPGKLNTAAKGLSKNSKKGDNHLANEFSENLIASGSEFPIVENGVFLDCEVSFLERDDGSVAFYVERIFAHGYKSKISFLRGYSRLMLKRLLYNWGDAGGLLLALLSGSKEYTTTELQENFSKAGLAHVLALSGMHLSIFAALPSKITRKKSNILSLCVVVLFVWFAGLSPSLFRALLCLILNILFSKLKIKTNLLGILSLSFLIQISIFPNHIFNYGFSLSYSALVGLDLGQKIFLPLFCRLFPKRISSDLSSSLGAQLITGPICLLGFGSCSPIGVISSVIVSPIATIFLSLGIFALILSLLIPFLLMPFGCIMSLIYVILDWIVNFFAKFPIIQI